MSVALITPNRSIKGIENALVDKLGTEQVQVWPDIVHPEEVQLAVTWDHPHEIWSRFPKLQAVLSLGAGADHLLKDPTIPKSVKLGRVVTPTLKQQMTEFVLMHVYWIQRRMPQLWMQQKIMHWKPLPPIEKGHLPVGILGMGQLGTATANLLVEHGFTVHGWSRSPKQIEGIISHHGHEGLGHMAEKVRILICLLPLTNKTKGVLNFDLFSMLSDSAWLIHVGRGEHLNEQDLIQALDSGQLDTAFVDVFHKEPLPQDHPFWKHSDIYITPHIASLTPPDEAARQIADDFRRIQQNQPLSYPVDRQSGY